MTPDPSRTDRRVNRTRRQLREALMALILERGYDAVTIEDITERADLGRTTFYLHYHDKEELLVESLEAIAEDLKAQVDRLADLEQEGEPETRGSARSRPVAVAFRHADEHRDLYRIILKAEGGGRAASRIRDIIYEAALDYFNRYLSRWMDGEPSIALPVIAGYFASALMGFMTWWLEKDLPYSGDEAADLFVALFFQGAQSVMHIRRE